MYGSSYMFRHYIAIFRERVPSALWEMLNWGAVDRILWMSVLCLVTTIHNILPTTPQLSFSQKAQGTLPDDGSVM
jgi:hypothetical protein